MLLYRHCQIWESCEFTFPAWERLWLDTALWDIQTSVSLALTLGCPATKLHPLQGGLVRLQGWPGALPKPLLGLFSELGSVLSPHARSHCVLGGIHAILCQNTDLLTGAFLRSNWARKHMSGFWFFPKAEVIPTHRAHSTGETRTTTCSHKNFSNSFAVFATVGGGFLGSLRCWGWSQPWG